MLLDLMKRFGSDFISCFLSLIACFFLMRLDKERDEKLGISEKHVIRDQDKFSFTGVRNLGSLYWLILFSSTMVNASIFCFTFKSSSFFQDRFEFDAIQAGLFISIVYFTGMVLCPIAGILTDLFGKKGIFINVSTSLIFLVHCLFILTPDSYRPILPIFYLALFGLGYAFYTTISLVALANVVNEKSLGTAFGIFFSISYLRLVIGPLIIGYIQENTEKYHGYYWVSVFLAVIALIGLVSGISAYLIDLNGAGAIDKISEIMKKPYN